MSIAKGVNVRCSNSNIFNGRIYKMDVMALNTGSTLYKKPFITAAVFLILGAVSFISGIVLESATGDMNYFALMTFGIFFIIISLVVFAVYGMMERKFKNVLNNTKILDFTLNDISFNAIAEKTGDEIKSANKGLLFIMLAFCIVFGLLGLIFLEDGIIFLFIFFGLGVFLTVMALIITTYRTHKLKKGSKRVILSKNAAYVAGEFHNWSIPGTALLGARFIPRNGTDVFMSCIEIKYGAITIPGPSEYAFVVPIPFEAESRAQEIISILLQQ